MCSLLLLSKILPTENIVKYIEIEHLCIANSFEPFKNFIPEITEKTKVVIVNLACNQISGSNETSARFIGTSYYTLTI